MTKGPRTTGPFFLHSEDSALEAVLFNPIFIAVIISS